MNAYLDIAYRGLPSTIEYLHFIYAFGLLVWATSMFASYAVFGHRRPINAVIVVGVVLVANMAITLNDQLWFLVLYSLASLFLLIRSHVFDEQSEWLRRRIGDPSSISSVYLRGGTIFIGVAVAGSVLLTQTASSAPLAGAFDGAQDSLVDLSRAVSRFLPAGGPTRAFGMTFGDSTQVSTVWNTDGSTALVIHRDPDRQGQLLLAGANVRPDRAEGLERERFHHRRPPRRLVDPRQAARRPRPDRSASVHVHGRSPTASMGRRSSRRGRRPRSRRTAA